MRLSELAPKWAAIDGIEGYVGLTFNCPHCQKQRLAILFHHRGKEVIEDEIIHAKLPDAKIWQMNGDSFENISISPSIDASASGHWHGFIVNGNIQ